MLALWVLLTFAILLFAIAFLLWRLRNCKCSLYETFESSTDAVEDTEDNKDADTKADAEDTKETKAEVEVKEPSKEVVEKDVEDTEDSETTAEKGTTKKAAAPTEIKKKNTGSSVADKFMNYSEMKIFDSLRDNAYSLQDIKRMIREGEINEKMIEKFLARVEKMEDRVQSKPESKTTIEGFAGNNYANAYFN